MDPAAYMVEGGGSKEFLAPAAWPGSSLSCSRQLIDLLTDAVIRYLRRQVEAGAEVLQLFDSWAGVLPEPELRRWCIEPTRRIVTALRARHPDVPVIAFPRGIGAAYAAFVGEVPVQGISLDTTVPVAWAARHLRHEPGAVPAGQSRSGGAAGGRGRPCSRRRQRIVAAYGDRPFIFNLGHGVTPETPPESVGRLVDYLKSLDG